MVGVGDTVRISNQRPKFTTYHLRDGQSKLLQVVKLSPFATVYVPISEHTYVSSDGGVYQADEIGGACAIDCFPSSTKVSTPHGKVAISKLRQGELVMTPTGSSRISLVLRSSTTHLIEIGIHGSTLRVSRGHALQTSRGWITAVSIVSGDRLVQPGGTSAIVETTKAVPFKRPIPVFNLVLEDGQSFIVGNGIQAKSAPVRDLAIGSSAPRRRVF